MVFNTLPTFYLNKFKYNLLTYNYLNKREKMRKNPIWSKKTSTVPKKLPKNGAVHIRPVSFHMDKTVDKYVVTGGGHEAVVVGGKRQALMVAHARIRVIKKHAMMHKKKK